MPGYIKDALVLAVVALMFGTVLGWVLVWVASLLGA